MDGIDMEKDIKIKKRRPRIPYTRCIVFTAATAAAIKLAYDVWYEGEIGNGRDVPVVISATMFGVTDLIVFYTAPNMILDNNEYHQ
jgi:hypothetical protein